MKERSSTSLPSAVRSPSPDSTVRTSNVSPSTPLVETLADDDPWDQTRDDIPLNTEINAVHLMPATDGSATIPPGFGYLHVPSPNDKGHIAVRTFYSPELRTTVIDERDFLHSPTTTPGDLSGDRVVKSNDSGSCTFHASHRLRRSQDPVVANVSPSTPLVETLADDDPWDKGRDDIPFATELNTKPSDFSGERLVKFSDAASFIFHACASRLPHFWWRCH